MDAENNQQKCYLYNQTNNNPKTKPLPGVGRYNDIIITLQINMSGTLQSYIIRTLVSKLKGCQQGGQYCVSPSFLTSSKPAVMHKQVTFCSVQMRYDDTALKCGKKPNTV